MGFRFTKQSACRSARVVLAESVPVTGGLSSGFKKLAVRTARVNSDSSVRTGELRAVELRVDESQDVAHGALPLRVVQDFVIHLRIPAHLGCAREAIREGAPEVRVYDAVFTREQQQEGAFDPLCVGDDGPLRPLDLAPRAGRYHVVDRRILAVRLVHRRITAELLGIEAQRHAERRPQVLQDPPGDPRPRRRLERESEPRAAGHRGSDRIAGLRLEVAQCHEPAKSQAEQDLAPLGAEPHGAAERLQVAEQLAEPRQVALSTAGAPVAALVEQIRGEPRVPQPFADLTPAARVVRPAVEQQQGGAWLRRLVRVGPQLRAVGRGEGRHQARARSRRSRSSAACAPRRRTSSRSTGNTRFTARVSVSTRAASHTLPPGFSGVAPPGPAIPVTAMLASVEKSRWAPSAIARTVSSETAPCACSVSSGTLRAAVLMTSAYATTPPMNVSDAPGMLVMRSATMP